MIIYGTRASHLRTQNISGKCVSCATDNSVQLSAFQRYAHVFWIPLFPIGKAYATQCNHCKQTLTGSDIKNSYRHPYEEINQQLSIPIWTFSGLGILSIVIISSMISGQKKEKENLALIQAPVRGDVYEYKTENGQYSLMKVADIIGDTVYIQPNNYAATKITALSKLKNQGDTTYSEDLYPMLKSELVKMFEEKEILDIDRK